jgi:hypothetical protein
MAVTPREMAEHQLKLVRERAARTAALREKVLSELPGIVEDLRKRFGVRRVVLFGSSTTSTRASNRSSRGSPSPTRVLFLRVHGGTGTFSGAWPSRSPASGRRSCARRP